jgi:hypothetical protein
MFYISTVQIQAASLRGWKVFPFTLAQAIPLPSGGHASRPFQTSQPHKKVPLADRNALNGLLGGADAASAT